MVPANSHKPLRLRQKRDNVGTSNHALRASLSQEMHLRKIPAFASPAHVMQIVLLHADGSEGRHKERILRTVAAGRPLRFLSDKYASCEDDDLHMVWECHNEFESYTFILNGASAGMGEADPFSRVCRDWLVLLDGEVIRATKITIVNKDFPDDALRRLQAGFSEPDLVTCQVANGRATVWADFLLHDDNFGHLLIRDEGLARYELAPLVQRLQELGNYRKLALLGLPLARQFTPDAADLERRLLAVTAKVTMETNDDRALLRELGAISAQLAHLAMATQYRMSATDAYAQLARERLASLGIGRLAGCSDLADFTDRRLQPAVRTCQAFSRRLERLSARVADTSALLRTRVDTELLMQNSRLLESMDRRAKVQLRLQKAVEGLSVVAITYYAVGLIAHVMAGFPDLVAPAWAERAVAMAIPLVAGSALLARSGIHQRVHRD